MDRRLVFLYPLLQVLNLSADFLFELFVKLIFKIFQIDFVESFLDLIKLIWYVLVSYFLV